MSAESAETVIRDVERQMQMRRPWDNADEWSQWEITGTYPGNRGTFTRCLAVVLPSSVHGTDETLFQFLGLMADHGPVSASRVTRAVPLLLVLRNEPATAYWAGEQAWLS